MQLWEHRVGDTVHSSPGDQLRLKLRQKAMASPPMFIRVSLHLMGTGEEVPRNAHKCPLPPIAVDPRFPQILFRKCPLSDFIPTGFLLFEKYGKKSFNWFLNHMSGSRNQPQKISVLTFTALR